MVRLNATLARDGKVIACTGCGSKLAVYAPYGAPVSRDGARLTHNDDGSHTLTYPDGR